MKQYLGREGEQPTGAGGSRCLWYHRARLNKVQVKLAASSSVLEHRGTRESRNRSRGIQAAHAAASSSRCLSSHIYFRTSRDNTIIPNIDYNDGPESASNGREGVQMTALLSERIGADNRRPKMRKAKAVVCTSEIKERLQKTPVKINPAKGNASKSWERVWYQ